MRTIWKFPLGGVLASPHLVEMPKGAILRRFELDTDGTPTIWAEVENDAPTETRTFATAGTGHPIDDPSDYVGSYRQGPFFWHVLEIKTRPWIEWEGGDCPVLGFVVVDCRTRDGSILEGPAGALAWRHTGGGDDILQYRESDEQPSE